MMKGLLLTISAMIATIFAFACKCKQWPLAAEVEHADKIFIGTVIQKTETTRVYYLFSVSQVFKGKQSDTLTIETGFGWPDCAMRFECGKTYLIYSKNSQTSRCRRNALADNNADIKELKYQFDKKSIQYRFKN